MKKLPLLVGTLVLALGLAPSAFAAGYGAAGCGLGGYLIKENTLLHQLGASFLNGISGNQTFAMTSGTLGCGKSGLVLAEAEQEKFVENNYFGLAKDMATGEGEDLTTLAGLLGCSDKSMDTFATFTQNNYSSIFTGEETAASDMLSQLKGELAGHPELSTSCLRL